MNDNGKVTVSESRVGRAPGRAWWFGVAAATAVAVAAIAVPVTIAQSGKNPQEANEPSAASAGSNDQLAAGSGDSAAAARILEAGGWSPKPGSVRAVAQRPAEGAVGAYTLWTYEGDSGPAELLIGATDPAGGVQTDCSGGPVLLRACGNAVSSEGYALVVGSVAPDTTRVVVRSDKAAVEATVGGGSWFARVSFVEGGPLPKTIVSYAEDGSELATISADSLARSISFKPAGAR